MVEDVGKPGLMLHISLRRYAQHDSMRGPQNRLSATCLAVSSDIMKIKSLFACALVASFLCVGASLRAADQPKDKMPWNITGQLEEACSCDAACPCWFNSKPTKMTCGGGQDLFIQKGNY